MLRLRTVVLGLALSSFIDNAWAQDVCARAQDITALQAAAVQQELMVAAFACNQSGLYNSFVVAYQKDLQDSDRALQAFFLRLNEATGAADYHTFKTKLANSYSLRSTGNARSYCGIALRAFRAALNEGKKTLAEFVLAQPVSLTANYDSCGERIEGGAMLAQAAVPATPPVATLASAVTPEVPPALPEAAVPSVLPSRPDGGNVSAQTSGRTQPDPTAKAFSARNRERPSYAPPPANARRYEARDRYARDPYARGNADSYGYSNRYGERDPYYRNPYDRYGNAPQYYYLRRR